MIAKVAALLAARSRRAGSAANAEAGAAELAHSLLSHTREELKRADAKASTLLAGALVVAGVGAGSGQAAQVLRLAPPARALWGLAVVAAAVGIALLCATIYPSDRARRARAARHFVSYFGHVTAHATPAELAEALRRRGAMPPLDRLSRELLAVSGLVTRKYRLTRWALWCFAAAGVLGVGAAVVAVIG